MYDILLNKSALADMEDIYSYLSGHSLAAAERHVLSLETAIQQLQHPDITWNYFFVTGAPYRARLFVVGKRTSFWIVYRVFETDNIVRIYRIWSASRNVPDFDPFG
jgi:plasmid stabilization system protein ParE